MAKLKCSCCKKAKPAEGVFIFEGENFCFACSCDLIHRLCDKGIIFMSTENMEENGVRLEL